MSTVRKPKDRSSKHLGMAVGLSVAVGGAIGAAVGHLGLWTSLGVPMEVAVYGVIGLLRGYRQ